MVLPSGTRGHRRTEFLAAGLLVVFVGCATRAVHVTTYPQQPTWKGRPREMVVAVWGEPQSQESDGVGGTILVYREQGRSGGNEFPDGDWTRIPVGRNGLPSSGRVERYGGYVEGDVKARFWIGPDGTVYQCEFSPRVFKKEAGKTVPPKETSETSPSN